VEVLGQGGRLVVVKRGEEVRCYACGFLSVRFCQCHVNYLIIEFDSTMACKFKKE